MPIDGVFVLGNNTMNIDFALLKSFPVDNFTLLVEILAVGCWKCLKICLFFQSIIVAVSMSY